MDTVGTADGRRRGLRMTGLVVLLLLITGVAGLVIVRDVTTPNDGRHGDTTATTPGDRTGRSRVGPGDPPNPGPADADPDADSAPLSLPEIGWLTVIVTDVRGSAIPGATVTALGRDDIRAVTSDANGLARFGVPEPGPWELEARAPGFAATTTERIELHGGSELRTRVILERAYSLRVRLVEADGTPIPDVPVAVYGVGMWGDWLTPTPHDTARSDADGVATLAGIPPGHRRVIAGMPDDALGANVFLPHDDEVLVIREHPLRATGRVTDAETGDPVEGALVREHWDPDPHNAPGQREDGVVTDAGGRYRLHGSGPPYAIDVIAAGYASAIVALKHQDYAYELVVRTDAVLQPVGVVEIEVLEAGRPLPFATLAIALADTDSRPFFSDVALFRTDGQGRATLAGLHPRAYDIGVAYGGGALRDAVPSVVTVPESGRVLVTVEAGHATGEFSGHVRDKAGAPVPGALVALGSVFPHHWCATLTAEDGTFRVSRAAAGRGSGWTQLWVQPRGWLLPFHVDPPEDASSPAQVVVPDSATVSGRFVLPDGSTPAHLRMTTVGIDERTPVVVPLADDASFLIRLPLGARLDYRVDGPDVLVDIDGTLNPDGGAVVDVGAIILTPATDVRGRVVDSAGRGIAGARIVDLSADHPMPFARSGPDGTFAFRHRLRHGDLAVDAIGHRRIDVADIDTLATTITLERRRDLHGLVVYEDGAPAVGCVVRCRPSSTREADELAAVTDNRGRFSWGDVVATQIDIRITPLPGRGLQPMPTSLLDVDATCDELRLVVARGSRLSGRIVDADGRPVADALVGVELAFIDGVEVRYPPDFDDEWWSGETTTDALGDFALDGLPSGVALDLRTWWRDGDIWSGVQPDSPPAIPCRFERTIADADVSPHMEFRLPPLATTRGTLLGPDGSPVPDEWVLLVPQAMPGGDLIADEISVATDANGQFECTAIHGVHYQIRLAGSSRFVESVGPTDTLVGGDHGTFSGALGGTVSGRLVDSDGEGLAGRGVQCNLAPAGLSPHVLFATTTSDGAFQLSGIPTSRETVDVRIENDRRTLAVTLRGIAPGTVDLRIVLDDGARAAGVVVDPDGGPAWWADRIEFRTSSSTIEADIDTDGRFDARWLRKGVEYEVFVIDGADEQPVGTARAGDVNLTFVFRRD